ncbi:MAG: hypothetical protein NC203_11220 [Firmicutes bacterium]|nr:hypothetical protein [[Eubacterium] siraeum]MCM1488925.1 hypothetical protein [Bacillota bacterium]
MGLFLETAIVNCSDMSLLKRSLSEISKEKPDFELKPEECRFHQRESRGIQLLLNENCMGYEKLAEAISQKISSYVMLLYIYDEDFWGYFLYDRGREIDRFSPDPEYFGEAEEHSKYKGNAEIVSKYFGIPRESIEKYLVKWTDEFYEDGDISAYENDRYAYADCWQMADFMKKLGFSYEW